MAKIPRATATSLLLLLLLCPSPNATASADSECDPIKVCSDFQQRTVAANASQPDIAADLENETVIGTRGSWQGVVPDDYKIKLTFQNRTHYNGSVDITFRMDSSRTAAKRIMINHGVGNPAVDYTTISITRICGRSMTPDLPIRRIREANAAVGRCIQKATFLEANETLILDLKGVELEAGASTRYVLSIRQFAGRSSVGSRFPTNEEPVGAPGLVESTVHGSSTYFSATTTIFQMRLARTVFPCFDHPALKALFHLCIQRPEEIMVASNMPMLKNESPTTSTDHGDLKEDCFQPTPKISTYVFTFALMENYTSESVPIPGGGPLIEVYAPTTLFDRFRWMFNETAAVVHYFESITKFKFPLPRLAFLAAYPSPFWGVENFGLVSVDGGFLQHPESTDTAYTILYHEIVHQWLGDVVTIAEWREICLQEGLTAYFEWKISAERRGRFALDAKAEQERFGNDRGGYYDPYALREYKRTQDIADWCYGRPSLFFHTVQARYGFGSLERLLEKMILKKPFGVTNMQTWDTTLAEATGDNDMKGYLKGWFLQPGPLYLLVGNASQNGCVIIRQKVYDGGNDTETPARIVPLNVTLYTGQPSAPPAIRKIISNKKETKVCEIGDDHDGTFLVDQEGTSVTRKLYQAEFYRRILQFNHGKSDDAGTTIRASILNYVGYDFCMGLLEDVLPTPDDPGTASDWLQVYSLFKNMTTQNMNNRRPCHCCLNSKEENTGNQMCFFQWQSKCRHLRLNKFVGYDYTLPEPSRPLN